MLASDFAPAARAAAPARYDFEVHPADIDEDDHPQTLLPADLAEWLATQKAEVMSAVSPARPFSPPTRWLRSATQSSASRRMPTTHARCFACSAVSTHMVVTGIAVRRAREKFQRSSRVISAVKMRVLTPDEIERYIATLDWQGKAGGYGIQDNDPFVTCVTGSFTNIVGLPIEETTAMLAEAGIIPTLNTGSAKSQSSDAFERLEPRRNASEVTSASRCMHNSIRVRSTPSRLAALLAR